jgi:hypothetical protein
MDLFNISPFRLEARQGDQFAPEPLRKRPRTYTRQPCACGAGYPMALPPMRGRSCRCLAPQTDGRRLVLMQPAAAYRLPAGMQERGGGKS